MHLNFFRGSLFLGLLFSVFGIFLSKADTVKASDFGYNKIDATIAFQKAIRSANDTIIIDVQEEAWNVGPSWFKNLRNKTIIFEPGVVLQQRKGAFKRKLDMLFRLEQSTNIIIIGYGAIFKMDRVELGKLPNEFRNSIALYDCTDIRIKGLKIEESGGDGLLISSRDSDGYCSNIHVKDVVFLNHLRQGMSIISLQNGLFENCVFKGTLGKLPGSGVDFEPNYPSQCLLNITFKNCSFIDNAHAGILFALTKTNGNSPPMKVEFYDSYVSNNNKLEVAKNKRGSYWGAEIQIGMSKDFNNPLKGSVYFERTIVENFPKYAFITKKTENAFQINFDDLFVYNGDTDVSASSIVPIQIQRYNYRNSEPALGGIHFDNLFVKTRTQGESIGIYGDSWFNWEVKNFSAKGIAISKAANGVLDRNRKLSTQTKAVNKVNIDYRTLKAPPKTLVSIKKAFDDEIFKDAYTLTRKSKDLSFPLMITLEFWEVHEEKPLALKKILMPSEEEEVTLSLRDLFSLNRKQVLKPGEIRIVESENYGMSSNARILLK